MGKNIEKKITFLSYLVLAQFFLTIALIGALGNTFVIATNGGKMPVYADWERVNSKEHFAFDDKNEVNNFLLTDIIPINMKSIEARISIGDILMLYGFLGVTGLWIYLLIGISKGNKGVNKRR